MSITDIKELRIPNTMLGAFILIRGGILVYEILQNTVYLGNVLESLLLITAIFVIGILLKVVSNGGIGFGDVKLLMCLVTYTGYDMGVKIIYSSILVMGVIDVISLVLRVKTRKDAMPFAPAVLGGTIYQLCVFCL